MEEQEKERRREVFVGGQEGEEIGAEGEGEGREERRDNGGGRELGREEGRRRKCISGRGGGGRRIGKGR